VIGFVGTFAAGHLMASMLFGVEPMDIQTFVLVVTTILVVASAAVLIPAWRAANLDAAAALVADSFRSFSFHYRRVSPTISGIPDHGAF
jgi:ABC-type antimicrobial peptide transport system permease subunit